MSARPRGCVFCSQWRGHEAASLYSFISVDLFPLTVTARYTARYNTRLKSKTVVKGAQRSKPSGRTNMALKCYFDQTEASLKAKANACCCVQSRAQVARQWVLGWRSDGLQAACHLVQPSAINHQRTRCFLVDFSMPVKRVWKRGGRDVCWMRVCSVWRADVDSRMRSSDCVTVTVVSRAK